MYGDGGNNSFEQQILSITLSRTLRSIQHFDNNIY